MSKKWNLQDIRPTQSERTERPRETVRPDRRSADMRPRSEPEQHVEESDDGANFSEIAVEDGKTKKRKRIVLSIIVAGIILMIGFSVTLLLGGAEVVVYPKYKDATVQATFTAYLQPSADELGYELLTLEANGERQVSATGKEEVSERATGNIFIYNEYSEAPQRLIKNTRFESPDGLIFRVLESVEVPGMTTGSNGEIVPGVITAEVFADGTGEQYNIGPSRFTIPGLEGTDQYDSMYADSTESFVGGFEGEKYIIDDAELETAKQALHGELRDALLARLDGERPAGFILYNDAITFTYTTLPATEYGDDLATIKESARLQVPIFDEDELAGYLAESTVVGYEREPVSFVDPYTLRFSYTGATTSQADISTFTELEFNLNGNVRIVWNFDEGKLKTDLVGVSKTALPTVLSGYPAIERAEATVKPFWSRSFPDKLDEITLTIQIGDGGQK